MEYIETFDTDAGGWYSWVSNSAGAGPLEVRDSFLISRSPWWIDYNHAPPGAGYMNLLGALDTTGVPGEHRREIAGVHRYTEDGFPTNFTEARMTLRLRGELKTNGTQLLLLIQGVHDELTSGWLLTGRPFQVTSDWSEQTITTTTDPAQWTCLGSRHDRTETYGERPLKTVLGDVNGNILLVLYPLNIEPMGPIAGDPHILRPEKDYPVWRSRLPEGYVMLDEVRIAFA